MYPSEMMINKMWDEFENLKPDLKRCKEYLIDFIDIPNDEVRACVLELVNSDAKLIRPALMITIGKILNGGRELDNNFIKMASTLEMLHMATLIHDDIVDDSPLRRGVKTVQSRYGKDVATYAGDYLLSSVFSNVLKYSKTMENAQKITESVSEILSGELIQMQNRGNISVEEKNYYKAIYGKTAVMIALCCYEGAYMVDKRDEYDNAWKLGESIGISFQIIDDIIDFSSEDIIKKPPFQDFKEGNFTLPIIYALRNNKDEIKNLRDEFLEAEGDLKKSRILEDKVRNKIEEAGGFEYSKNKANDYGVTAMKIVNEYKEGEYKKYLEKIVKRLLERSY